MWTTSPSATGVVHDAGVPLRPSTSIRHRRQEPNASRLSVAHSFGICVPTSIAARMIDVPAGTVTWHAVDRQRDRLRRLRCRRSVVDFLDQHGDSASESESSVADREVLGKCVIALMTG